MNKENCAFKLVDEINLSRKMFIPPDPRAK